MPVTIHEHTIALKGLVGLIMLLFAISSVFYVMGFASVSWSVTGDSSAESRKGLWASCLCSDGPSDSKFILVYSVENRTIVRVSGYLVTSCFKL